MSSYEMITDIYSTKSATAISSVGNCTLDVYRDQFDMRINNFTTRENGYYWCQMSINDTYVQPSHHAFFAAATNCNRYPYLPYFRLANSSERKCARYLNMFPASLSVAVISKIPTSISSVMSVTQQEISVLSTPVTKSSITLLATATTVTGYKISTTVTAVSSMTLATRSTTISLTMTSTQHENLISSERSVITYVAGSLSALVLILGTLVITLSIMYLCKFERRKPSKYP